MGGLSVIHWLVVGSIAFIPAVLVIWAVTRKPK